MITGGATDNLQHFQNWDATANELSERARKTRHANLMHERSEHRQLQFPAVGQLLPALGMEKGTDSKNQGTDTDQEEIPFAADEIADIDQELSWGRQLGAEIFENFTEDWHHAHNQKRGNGECDANHDDRIGHG